MTADPQLPATGSWRDLLVADATEPAYAEHRRRLLVQPGADPDEVDREVQQVHLLRPRLALLRHSADEMLVLNDLARRLASLRVPDDVLREVSARARRLLGVNVAYTMLLGTAEGLVVTRGEWFQAASTAV